MRGTDLVDEQKLGRDVGDVAPHGVGLAVLFERQIPQRDLVVGAGRGQD